MERLIKAWQNSVRAFGRLMRSETAFQQELILLLVVAFRSAGSCPPPGATMRC